MSFRDLRNFTERMRVLGYSRIISLMNFRNPNFPLVAEILVWLVKRFDPDMDIPVEHDSEHERVALIRNVAEFLAVKTNVKLNTKKLYQADGHAVKELLKISSLLYEAQKKSSKDDSSSITSQGIMNIDLSEHVNELRTTRQLASQLTFTGASLFDLLGKEVELREIRNAKVGRQFDSNDIENALKEVIESTKKEITDIKKQTDSVKETEQSLDTRIDRRRNELDRNQKRLQTLRKVRPAFMEEFEKLEVELRALHDDYVQKFRYLAYLEHLHEDAAKAEQERFEKKQEATKKQLQQLKSEDGSFESMMEGNDSILPMNLQEAPSLDKKIAEKNNKGSIRSSRTEISQRRIYGSMSGRRRGITETADSASLDSDSDLLIDGDDDDDDEDDDENDGLLINNSKPDDFDVKTGQKKRIVNKADNFDEDF